MVLATGGHAERCHGFGYAIGDVAFVGVAQCSAVPIFFVGAVEGAIVFVVAESISELIGALCHTMEGRQHVAVGDGDKPYPHHAFVDPHPFHGNTLATLAGEANAVVMPCRGARRAAALRAIGRPHVAAQAVDAIARRITEFGAVIRRAIAGLIEDGGDAQASSASCNSLTVCASVFNRCVATRPSTAFVVSRGIVGASGPAASWLIRGRPRGRSTAGRVAGGASP